MGIKFRGKTCPHRRRAPDWESQGGGEARTQVCRPSFASAERSSNGVLPMGCARSKDVHGAVPPIKVHTHTQASEESAGVSAIASNSAFVQNLDLPAPTKSTATPDAALDRVLLLSELGPIKAIATADSTCTCSKSEARVTLVPGVVVAIAKAKPTTRYEVVDAVEDAQVEMDDFGEATGVHELPDGGWMFEAVNDPEPGQPLRFDVSARRVIGGKAYTAMASVGTVAHQAMAADFCRWLTTSEANDDAVAAGTPPIAAGGKVVSSPGACPIDVPALGVSAQRQSAQKYFISGVTKTMIVLWQPIMNFIFSSFILDICTVHIVGVAYRLQLYMGPNRRECRGPQSSSREAWSPVTGA